MKHLCYCIDCNKEFHNPKWNSKEEVCPRCDSNRWYDITKEKKTFRNLPSDECIFP